MFTKKIPIIYLTKDKLKVVLVKLGKQPKIIKSDETGWNKDSLADSFKQAKKQLKAKTIRLLLADDLSYVLQLNIPFDTKLNNERQLVEEKIKTEIPEILDHDDWDYKETGRKTQNDKQIIAFAPVQSAFTLISQALADANLKVEAVEPEVVSKIRNTNPLIGIALKKDLKGKDEKVLNITPKKLEPLGSELPVPRPRDDPDAVGTSSEPEKISSKDSLEPKKEVKKPKVNKTLIISFLTTLILGALIAGGILVQRSALEKRPSPTPTPLVIPSQEPSPTPTPLPSPEPEIILSDYTIQVLNGTGGKGVAGVVKDLLEAEGFEEINADNAEELNYQKTTIQLKVDTPDAVWSTIDRTLNSDYDLEKSESPLSKDSDYDVIITVGELLKEAE